MVDKGSLSQHDDIVEQCYDLGGRLEQSDDYPDARATPRLERSHDLQRDRRIEACQGKWAPGCVSRTAWAAHVYPAQAGPPVETSSSARKRALVRRPSPMVTRFISPPETGHGGTEKG